MNLLQKYIFVPLDIFKQIQHNENRAIKIETRLEAWLAFLCMDEPEAIIEIIERYPDFREMYTQVYEICRNTTKLMIDEMQKDIEQKEKELKKKDEEIQKLKEELQKQK